MSNRFNPIRAVRAALAASILVVALGGTALAGKPAPSGGNGSCSVTPNPVALNAQYTVTGTNLGASRSVNVYVQGSGGMNTFFRYTDASGTTSVTWYASWTGSNNVSIYSSSGRKEALLASCSFTVN